MIESRKVEAGCSNLNCNNKLGEGGFEEVTISPQTQAGELRFRLCSPCKLILDAEIVEVHQGS